MILKLQSNIFKGYKIDFITNNLIFLYFLFTTHAFVTKIVVIYFIHMIFKKFGVRSCWKRN